jgi:protein CpxP
MVRAAGMAVGAGMAAVLLANGAAPARAALSEEGLTPGALSRPLILAQAPAPQPPNVEANIAQLHQRLAITPAQEPQFSALANIMRQNARMMPAGPPPANLNAVDGLRLAIQYGQQEIDGMRRMLPALQALYAVLTPAQRQAADQAFRQGPGQ